MQKNPFFSDPECYKLVTRSADNKASTDSTTAISPYTTSGAYTEFPNIFIKSCIVIITLFLFKEQNHIYLLFLCAAFCYLIISDTK